MTQDRPPTPFEVKVLRTIRDLRDGDPVAPSTLARELWPGIDARTRKPWAAAGLHVGRLSNRDLVWRVYGRMGDRRYLQGYVLTQKGREALEAAEAKGDQDHGV